MDWLSDPQAWISLLTLTVLEIVLGIDNIIFISILAGKLPPSEQGKARTIGLSLALVMRVALLFSIFWLTRLTAPLLPNPEAGTGGDASIFAKAMYWLQGLLNHEFAGKDLVLLAGGLFLIWKSVHEIHTNLEGEDHEKSAKVKAALSAVVGQIVLIDIVFSLDSVITAVGLAKQIGVMVAAVVIAMGVMLVAAKSISEFVNRHPTIKMLGLAFLLLVGVILVADGCGRHVEKGYIYFAMAFSFVVEMLNIRARTNKAAATRPVELRKGY
jgi:predicted tellurium resistance membrane protein TerC